MAIEYAPIIDEILPAFYSNSISIPFRHNKAVSQEEGSELGVCLRITSLYSGLNIYNNIYTSNIDWDNKIITYKEIASDYSDKLKAPNHYKIQIAYAKKNKKSGKITEIGPYSTVGIIKYSNKPVCRIIALDDKKTLKGIFRTKDFSEKLYSYYFTIKDSKNKTFLKTEVKFHNSSTDGEYSDSQGAVYLEAVENFVISKIRQPGETYKGYFSMETINGIKLTSSAVEIETPESIEISTNYSLITKLDQVNGGIKILINPLGTSEIALDGKYRLVRTSSKDNFQYQSELVTLSFRNKKIRYGGKVIWEDLTVEQGVSYRYALLKMASGSASFEQRKDDEKAITADFEDLFLFDGERQLRIAFNPKVTNFKRTLFESKQETIGGKYPFIFRSGHIDYKEFPISGLISHLADEQSLFMEKNSFLKEVIQDENLYNNNGEIVKASSFYTTTDLTPENTYNERQFKLEVLDWLTNGKPKLFRSPAEGNYLVRLMNTSLAPLSDGINRIVHTFSSTAYEIDDFSVENLIKYKIINSSLMDSTELVSKTIKLDSLEKDINLLSTDTDLKGKTITSLLFSSGPNDETTKQVKINGENVDIYNGFKVTGKINYLSRGEETQYGSSWRVEIFYETADGNYILKNYDILEINSSFAPCFQAFGRNINLDNASPETNLIQMLNGHNPNRSSRFLSQIYSCKISFQLNPITLYMKTEDNKNSYYYDKEFKWRVSRVPGMLYYVKEKVGDTWQTYKNGYYYIAYESGEFSSINLSTLTPKIKYKLKNENAYRWLDIDKDKEIILNVSNLQEIYATVGVVIQITCRLGFKQYNIFNTNTNDAKTNLTNLNNSINSFLKDKDIEKICKQVNGWPSTDSNITANANIIDKITGKDTGSMTKKSKIEQQANSIIYYYKILDDDLNSVK